MARALPPGTVMPIRVIQSTPLRAGESVAWHNHGCHKYRPFCSHREIRSSARLGSLQEKLLVARKAAAALAAQRTMLLGLMMPKNACVPNKRHQLGPMKYYFSRHFAFVKVEEKVGVRRVLDDPRRLCHGAKQIESSTQLLAS